MTQPDPNLADPNPADPSLADPSLADLSLGEIERIAAGQYYDPHRVLGAHVREVGQTSGASFAVWAPNAHGVRVTGDFNGWDGRAYPMRSLGGSGVWELFVPGVSEGTTYKYAICGPDGVWRDKADPMANAAETPPATASVIYTSRHAWGDSGWIQARAEREPVRGATGIYGVALGSVRPGLAQRGPA